MKTEGVVLELPAGSTRRGPDDWHGVLTLSQFQTSAPPPHPPQQEAKSKKVEESIKVALFIQPILLLLLLLRLPEMVYLAKIHCVEL